jgi:hypothetical protein
MCSVDVREVASAPRDARRVALTQFCDALHFILRNILRRVAVRNSYIRSTEVLGEDNLLRDRDEVFKDPNNFIDPVQQARIDLIMFSCMTRTLSTTLVRSRVAAFNSCGT